MSTLMQEHELLTIGEAAKLLSVSIDTLRRWDRDGKLRAVRLTETSYRRYRKRDIEQLIAKESA